MCSPTRKPFLETTHMKLSFLSKSISTLGLVAALSVVVGSSVQQSVQAQIRPQAETEAWQELEARIDNNIYIDAEKQAQYCDGDFSSAPARSLTPDGMVFGFEYTGIEFSPEQQAALDQFEADVVKYNAETFEGRGRVVVDPINGPIAENGFIPEDMDDEERDRLAREIIAFRATLDADPTLTSEEKITLLNEEFRDNRSVFFLQEVVIYSPEQLAQMDQLIRERKIYVFSLLTPEQQEIYLENLAVVDMIEAECPPGSLY
jgi:hypothetical protein